MDEVGVKTLNPTKYGQLCAEALPRVIRNDQEFDRMVEKLEELDFRKIRTPEEQVLAELLAKLIEDYDDQHYPLPEAPPHETVQFLMAQKGLKQADLVPVLGSRAQVSALVNGTRGISKAQVKKLAEFFHVSAEVFL